MAETAHALSSAQDVVRWSSKLNREVLKRTLAMKFRGEGSSAAIQVHNDLSVGAGSTMKVFLRMQPSGGGVQGDAEVDGKEESLTYYPDSVVINQLRQPFKTGGRMSAQRVTWDDKAESRDAAADWWADRIDTSMFNLLAGYTPQSDTRYSGNNAITAPTKFFRPGAHTTDELISADSSAIFEKKQLDRAINQAQIQTPPIRPINVDGKDHYICVLSSNTVRTMQDATSDFYALWLAAMQGGRVDDNPLINGSLGVVGDVIFYSSSRIPNGVHSSSGAALTNVKRNLFLGAQAGHLCYGQRYGPGRYDWFEELLDAGNKFRVTVGLIFGMKKAVYNSADYGVIVLPSYAPDPS